jgi:FtsZ-binding cell division protein ZapB
VLDRLGVIEGKQTELEQTVQTSTAEIDNLKDKNAGLEQSVSGLETKNADLRNKVNCQELIKNTPENGPMQYIHTDIVRYYKTVLQQYEEFKIHPSRPDDPEESEAEIKFYDGLVNEAKPLYDSYLAQCGGN